MARARSVDLPSSAARPRRGGWRAALLLAVTLFVLDALLLGQGLLAGLILVTIFGWLVPKALLLVKVERDARPTVRLALLLAFTAVAIMLTINANNRLARQRALGLVKAVEIYRAVHGRYPLALDALVPRYLAEVPRAKYTLAFGDFVYQREDDRALLGYVEVPPYGRPCYDFAARRWQDIDWRGLAGGGACGARRPRPVLEER